MGIVVLVVSMKGTVGTILVMSIGVSLGGDGVVKWVSIVELGG
jgi:hypothetical protein